MTDDLRNHNIEERTCSVCGDMFVCRPTSRRKCCSSYCAGRARGAAARRNNKNWVDRAVKRD